MYNKMEIKMKYLLLVLIGVSNLVMAQSINLTASGTDQTAEIIFLSGKDVSLGIASGINDGNHGASVSYHPLSFDVGVNIEPYFRYRDGVSVQDKARKMYGYDYGIKIGYINILRTNTVISGYSSYSKWQFGFSISVF